MKKTTMVWIIALIVVLAIIGGVVYAHHKAEADTSETVVTEDGIPEEDTEGIDNGIYFDEELEDAVLTFKDASEEDFYGEWEATSGQSVFMYGNVDLNIKKGGKWTGNIAEEDLSGDWTFDGKTLTLTSELFNGKLSFTEDGKLILQEDREGDEDYINTVLTKK